MSTDAGAVVAVLALVILALASVRVVRPQQIYVVDLLGRYRRTLGPGPHLLIPFIESVRAKLPVGEQAATFPPQPAITSDDLVACIRTVVHYRVVDPVRATYEISDPLRAMEMATTYVLRILAGSMTFDRVRASPHEISARLTGMLDEKTADWGVNVIRVEITAIEEGSRSGCA